MNNRRTLAAALCHAVFFSFLWILSVAGLYGQNGSAIPLDAYGVWDRTGAIVSDPTNPDYDNFVGIHMDIVWRDLQPDPETFNWAPYQDVLDAAELTDRYVYVSVRVGPESPNWIYSNGVPLVNTNSPKFGGKFPYSLDQDYIDYYYAMIDALGVFIRSQPLSKVNRIAFVQVMTGATGDETPYKGPPLDPQYDISKPQWENFRQNAFERFRLAFLEGDPATQVPLLFNRIDDSVADELDSWNWVIENIGSGFGVKGSAYVRGHHLTSEMPFKEQWDPYLVDPEGLALFSRAEMDRSWLKGYFSINTPLGFYWGALGGLNTGLSVWDWNERSLEEAVADPKVMDTVEFFNLYAPQIYPEKATAAYSIFHLGLNSANTDKYPEEVFGNASKGNEDRYIAICEAYASQGARMDDPFAATKGQVYQRDKQEGYNDAGWEIQEGNYERWIYQIDADDTSVGLFRVRGEIDSNSSKYDRFARKFDSVSGKNEMYFKFGDKVFAEAEPGKLVFYVTWLDQNAGSTWDFRYDGGSGEMVVAASFQGVGDNEWKTETVVITDGAMLGNGPRGSDFMLVNTDEIDDVFHGIEVDINRVGGEFVEIVSPIDGAAFIIADDVVVEAFGADPDGIDRMRFRVDGGSYNNVDTAPYAYTFSDLGLGQHELQVQMLDLLGNRILSQVVTINITEPVADWVSIASPSDGDVFTVGDDITVTADGFDNDGIESMRFRVDGGGYNNVFSAPYSYTFSGLSVGEHVFEVQMKDSLSNRIVSEKVTVTIVEAPPEDSVSIASPNDGAVFNFGDDITVIADAFDNDGIERLRFRVDGGGYNNVFSAPYSYTFIGLSVGEHVFEVQMKDDISDRILSVPVTVTVVMPGDLDYDGDIDIDDRSIIQGAFRTSEGDPGFVKSADLDGDGVVSHFDYRIWYKHWTDSQTSY